MAFQPVVDVAQCVVEGRQDGQMVLNDLYFQISGGGITPTNIAELAEAVDDWGSGSLTPNLSSDYSYLRTVAVDLTTGTGPTSTFTSPTTGGIASESAPNNVAACVSFRTASRGRSGRGRNFVAGVSNSAVALNTLSAPFMDDILTAYRLLIGPGTFLAGWQWVVVSRKTAGAFRPAGLAIPIVDVIFTTPFVRSMRSREVGHGA